ncbi:MAG: hydrogen gas-evolving membrane-bound hydrogenase subunit E [Candidatus Marinimicrobia bacterium]|nr:hydrogen gas-evolving membrane-bound hydrogenase subunit E [Candidatus Neomarinimicrobiota bacterium]
MPIETWLTFILGFMIIGSIVALEIKDILSAVIAVGVVGLGVSISFVFLQAPDLAIVQFLFEIFALIIMVRAFVKKDYHQEEPSKVNKILIGITIITLLAILYLTAPILNLLPQFGKPLMNTAQYYLNNGASDTGAANLVTSIILDYRAYDTLGEITVLFTAILGALTILRIKSKSHR